MTRTLLIRTLAVLVLVLHAPATALAECGPCADCQSHVEDVVICGCSELTTGQIGVEGVYAANMTQSIEVPVSIATTGPVRPWGVDIEFPADLLRYESAGPGDLTAGFIFGANELPGGIVRVGAFAGEIPGNQSGEIAVLTFTVTGEGCGSFCLTELFDDVADYDPCEIAPPTSMGVSFDIRPGSCPNRLRPFRASTFQAAIMGTPALDVSTITTVELMEAGGSTVVTPLSTMVMVLPDPVENGCDCVATPPDGISDLVLTFDELEVLDALGPSPSNTDERTLTIEGITEGGLSIRGADCVRVLTRWSEPADLTLARFDPVARVYRLPTPEHVRLQLFDVSGRLIDTLVNQARPAGTHHVELNEYASGVYFVRFETSAMTTNHKVVIVR